MKIPPPFRTTLPPCHAVRPIQLLQFLPTLFLPIVFPIILLQNWSISAPYRHNHLARCASIADSKNLHPQPRFPPLVSTMNHPSLLTPSQVNFSKHLLEQVHRSQGNRKKRKVMIGSKSLKLCHQFWCELMRTHVNCHAKYEEKVGASPSNK